MFVSLCVYSSLESSVNHSILFDSPDFQGLGVIFIINMLWVVFTDPNWKYTFRIWLVTESSLDKRWALWYQALTIRDITRIHWSACIAININSCGGWHRMCNKYQSVRGWYHTTCFIHWEVGKPHWTREKIRRAQKPEDSLKLPTHLRQFLRVGNIFTTFTHNSPNNSPYNMLIK